jgi:hypothetical protein
VAAAPIGARKRPAQTAPMDDELEIESLSDLLAQLAAIAALELVASILLPTAALWGA